MSVQTSPSPSATAGAPSAPAVAVVPPWLTWAALWTVYIVWGSTYLAIRIMVETMPPLLSAGARFAVAGAAVIAVLAVMRRPVKLDRATLAGTALVGTLLMGANGLVTIAEQEVPSSLAALIFASVPLWVILLRRSARERVSRGSVAAVAIGFGGVALLMRPGPAWGDATLLGLVGVLAAAAMWASGSFASPRVSLPRDPLASVAWQMILGGLITVFVGLALGEAADVRPEAFSARSLLAFAYLIVFGSWIAFTAYGWLLQNAPVSKVATYAYVNPVVAIALGAIVLDEAITASTLAGAAVIVVSVALVVTLETRRADA